MSEDFHPPRTWPRLRRRKSSILEQITVKKTAATKTPNPGLDAIGVTALAKSQKADKHRDLLQPGIHHCAFTVFGTIDKQKWDQHVNGVLTIGADQPPTATSTMPYKDLLQAAISSMPAKQRQAFLAVVASGKIPEPECSAAKAAQIAAEIEPAFAQYGAAHPASKRGTVTFTPTAAEA